MSSSRKSSGLRMLWIPGGRKGHPKGRFDSTSKKITYSTGQKKSEVWSLGGSRAQKDLLNAHPDTGLLDGPSVSGLVPVTCAIGAVGGAATCPTNPAPTDETNEIKPDPETIHSTPNSPSSTTSTAPLLSPPNSPDPVTIDTMPTKTTTTTAPPVIITTTATAEIIDENRFSILGKDISNEIDIYDLPSPPKDDLNLRDNILLNTSAGSTASSATTPSASPRNNGKSTKEPGDTPTKKKASHHRSQNNNQGDVNSIESISDTTKMPNLSDLDWIDELMLERNGKEILHKSKKKKKKKLSTAKELDQLDGVPMKLNPNEVAPEEDEKVVKCLYYTLMCCDCTIS